MKMNGGSSCATELKRAGMEEMAEVDMVGFIISGGFVIVVGCVI